MVRAVLFDVDFTLFRPGPELGPDGYRRLGERHGLTLDPGRYDDARFGALDELQRHPELVLPTFDALRRHGLRLGLVSNGQRDLEEFVAHHGLDVDAAVGSAAFGRTKPHPSIFLFALERLDAEPEAAAMVGDSYADDIAGARSLGMQAFLLDRDGRFPDEEGRLGDLRELPAALGLS